MRGLSQGVWKVSMWNVSISQPHGAEFGAKVLSNIIGAQGGWTYAPFKQ